MNLFFIRRKVKRTEDVFCDGKKKFEVYLKAGIVYVFETAMKPKKNTKCVVNYKVIKKESFPPNVFNLTNFFVSSFFSAGEWMQECTHMESRV